MCVHAKGTFYVGRGGGGGGEGACTRVDRRRCPFRTR